MPKQTVRQGSRYRAKLSLGILERLASNDMVAKRFADLGFVDVRVTGDGAERMAEARWPLPDAEDELPNQIVHLVEI